DLARVEHRARGGDGHRGAGRVVCRGRAPALAFGGSWARHPSPPDLLLRGGPCRAGARPHVAARRHERRALLRAHGAAPGAHARRGAAPGFRRTAASTVVGASRHTTTPPGAAL